MTLDENMTIFCSLIILSLLSTYLIYLLTKTDVTKTESTRSKEQILDDTFEDINVQVSNIHTMIDRIKWHERNIIKMNKELDIGRARKY